MALSNQDILFASLVGSEVVKLVPRFTALENELAKHVLPTVPFLPIRNQLGIDTGRPSEIIGDIWQADRPQAESEQFFPLSLSIDEGKTYFLLPYEPMITISSKNNVVKRNVAKQDPNRDQSFQGTIKERWSRDDYQIQITGYLMGSMLTGNVEDCFPLKDFVRLKNVLTTAKKIMIKCPPLEQLGINFIVIEDFSFPFTKGENVQAYNIKALSDFSYQLLIEEKDV
ncbi:DUF6046 domain-containing protein [Sphingobacterium siyangense]|uniref:DUF6046 domain-containing protein n=1 Tax=Sphingobacterium siyangense TaxID=459529 RepID=A0A562MRJ6_9SPHI|nr:DUF6046 domain-containing protein [Sphingobacterium siyangense]TWI22201.1 hypothetical protein IQ31_01606 [Sphingobacterium siyangense]